MSSENTFAALGLAPALLRAIDEAGYSTPTPIQQQAIPVVLSGRDLLAAAQTGTGKTAGFTLPILQLLSTRAARVVKPGTPRVLVLTPTRELAAQVEESVRTYGKHLPLSSMVMFGGVGMQPQIDKLKKRVDILVATPGRLLDHAGQKTLDLSGIEILVLDEADRMLDMGFIHDIKRVLKLLPAQRQNLLYSATFSDEIRQLAQGLLHNPASVEVARRNTASELVTQRAYLTAKDQKRYLLAHLITQGSWEQVLVFTRTKHGANRLAEFLDKNGLPAMAIHGNKSQSARTKALGDFKAGTLRVLVATDIAARGLDIDQLPHVVNYELPNVPEDYVHRIGRTGRAGATGEAVSLVDPEEQKFLRDIERLIRREVPRAKADGFVPAAVQQQASADGYNRPRPPMQPRRHGGGGGGRGQGGERRSNGGPPGSRQGGGGNGNRQGGHRGGGGGGQRSGGAPRSGNR
ncbi:MAG: DEAD/DEAH box helicase [Pseudomonadota bacterium]